MAKKYSVTPIQRNGTFYSATFRDAMGKRITRGLGTANVEIARVICAGLVGLFKSGVKIPDDVPKNLDVHPDARNLYFGVTGDEYNAATIQGPLKAVYAILEAFPVELRATLLPVFLERNKLREAHAALKVTNKDQAAEISRLKEELAALKRTVIGQMLEAGKNVPDMADAIKLFEATMKAETTEFNARVVLSVVNRFIASLEGKRKNAVEITADDIGRFLDAETARGEDINKKATRRDAIRRRVGRFINWSADRWLYTSQMKAIATGDLGREKSDPHYHELADVKAALESLPNDYWKTLIATLAFAGLQLAELVWLRKSDVTISADGTSGKLRITTVDDGNGGKHLLKTDHRRREVNLHPTQLLPLIKSFLASEHPGEIFLFAIPKADRVDDRERWLVNSLSCKLNGHRGGKRRRPTAALLPAGMNAKSLRRTFGSLLLRSGKTTVDVAAAMGNTPEVVTRNYAKLRGHEVTVNF